MKLPDIGDTITTERALELCKHFKLDYLINRIEASPDRYEIWKFDGCSCLRDKMMGLWTNCPWRDITYKCCLPHDLCYAYGDPGNDIERERVDIKFYSDLVTKAGMKKWMARAFYEAVRIGGKEEFGLSFSWGFAHKQDKLLTYFLEKPRSVE